MGHWVHFTQGNEITLEEFCELTDVLLKAAGYKPHCPCGCSPAAQQLPEPTEHDGLEWTSAPHEHLLFLQYANTLPEEHELSDLMWGWITPEQCLLVSTRIEGLLDIVQRIAPETLETMTWLAAEFRANSQTQRSVYWP